MVIELPPKYKSLRQTVTSKGKICMKESTVKIVIKQLLRMAHIMHEYNIKHGNLTLDNVLLRGKNIFLTSFEGSTINKGSQLKHARVEMGYNSDDAEEDKAIVLNISDSINCPVLLDLSSDIADIGEIAVTLLTDVREDTESAKSIVSLEGKVSEKCLQFIQYLTMDNPKMRFTAKLALQHPWFVFIE